jgi:hypothetical protein
VFLAPAALLGIAAGRNRHACCASPEVMLADADATTEPSDVGPAAR